MSKCLLVELMNCMMQFIGRPAELRRPIKRMWPANSKATTKPLSGWMCADVQHDLETYSLLSTLPQSFSGEGIANISSAVEEIMPEIKHVYLRLSSAIVFALPLSITNWVGAVKIGALASYHVSWRQYFHLMQVQKMIFMM